MSVKWNAHWSGAGDNVATQTLLVASANFVLSSIPGYQSAHSPYRIYLVFSGTAELSAKYLE